MEDDQITPREALVGLGPTKNNGSALNLISTDYLSESESLKERRRVCFVAMPAGAHDEYSHGVVEADFVYLKIIEPAVQKAFNHNVEVIREMDNREPGSITKKIVSRIATADVVVVDITGQNPNVFFELGIRYALRRKTTVLLRQKGVPIPFDVQNFRCVEYSPFAIEKAIDLIASVVEAGQKSVSGGDSLVHEVLPEISVRGIPGVEPDEGQGEAGQMPWQEYWRRIEDIWALIRNDIHFRGYAPSVIVGISNGGMIFADILGRLYQGSLPVVSLWANRRKAKNFFECEINKQLLRSVRDYIAPRSDTIELLLVDDMFASGTTVTQAIDYVKEHVPEASISFIPLFSRNEKYVDSISEYLLWNKPTFSKLSQLTKEKITRTAWTMLPYNKDIRSA
jgi:hypoxanthine phosphoribosyltransferase